MRKNIYQFPIYILILFLSSQISAKPDAFFILHKAIKTNNEKQFKYALKLGANPNWGLKGSIKLGHTNLVKLCIQAGAHVKGTSTGLIPSSPLAIAARYGHLDIVKLLINNGASVHTYGAILQSFCSKNVEVTRYLVENYKVDVNTKFKTPQIRIITPIVLAVGSGSWKTVKYLLEKNANVKTRFIRGREQISALEIAVNDGYPKIVDLLKKPSLIQ